jgi:hypothetical protein
MDNSLDASALIDTAVFSMRRWPPTARRPSARDIAGNAT